MRHITAAVLMVLLVSVSGLGQETGTEAEQLGADTAQQALEEVSVSRFEDPGFWKVNVPRDQGVIQHRRLEGTPADKEPIEGEQEAGIQAQDTYVLGVKTEFFPPRSSTSITVEPQRPLPVPGITKTISVWVVGRNFNHDLYILLRDLEGDLKRLRMGKLNFSGWKKLTVAVPPTVQQQNVHYPQLSGIQIVGFEIEPDLMEAYGDYYVYFDALRVTTDLFIEQSRDEDDMNDSW